jgi:hypothetical protein
MSRAFLTMPISERDRKEIQLSQTVRRSCSIYPHYYDIKNAMKKQTNSEVCSTVSMRILEVEPIFYNPVFQKLIEYVFK